MTNINEKEIVKEVGAPTELVVPNEALTAEKLIGSDDMAIFRSIDQSIRVRTGLKFNDEVTRVLKGMHNGNDVVFVKAEPEFKKKMEKRGYKGKPVYLKMDHQFLIVDDDKKEILVVLSDGTTTFRNDRAKIKRSEGVDQKALENEIEDSVRALDTKYKKYTMKHVNLLVFPTKMNFSLRRIDKEKTAIREFCIHLNYSLSSFRTKGRCHQIDAAMTIDEMEAVIKEIATNKYKYSFDQDTFANAWKNLFNTMDYLPSPILSAENAQENKDNLLYALKHHPNDYEKSELDDFAAACGITPWRKNMTNSAKRNAIHKYIDNNF
jgi:hypothetical protein